MITVVILIVLLLSHVCSSVWLASISIILLLLVLSGALLYLRESLVLRRSILELTILSIIWCTISIVRLSITILCSVVLWCTISGIVVLSTLSWGHHLLLVAILSIVWRHRHLLLLLILAIITSHLIILVLLLVVVWIVILLLILSLIWDHWRSWLQVIRSWWFISLTHHEGGLWCASIVLATLNWHRSLALYIPSLLSLAWLACATHKETHALLDFALFLSWFIFKELIIFFFNVDAIDVLSLLHDVVGWLNSLWLIISILWNVEISVIVVSTIILERSSHSIVLVVSTEILLTIWLVVVLLILVLELLELILLINIWSLSESILVLTKLTSVSILIFIISIYILMTHAVLRCLILKVLSK